MVVQSISNVSTPSTRFEKSKRWIETGVTDVEAQCHHGSRTTRQYSWSSLRNEHSSSRVIEFVFDTSFECSRILMDILLYEVCPISDLLLHGVGGFFQFEELGRCIGLEH